MALILEKQINAQVKIKGKKNKQHQKSTFLVSINDVYKQH